jgi:hypothetical protein
MLLWWTNGGLNIDMWTQTNDISGAIVDMKDFSQVDLETNRPVIPAHEAINFCLSKLFEDTEHRISDPICKGVIFQQSEYQSPFLPVHFGS